MIEVNLKIEVIVSLDVIVLVKGISFAFVWLSCRLKGCVFV
jgi:hypothetical protein